MSTNPTPFQLFQADKILVNMKYTVDVCVYTFPNANQTTASTSCGDACAGPSSAMQIALTDRLLETNMTLQYQYCDDLNGAFAKNVDACTACLANVPSSQTLINCT